MDDFGTGYSSLSYLKMLPIDRLKLDRSFVCDIDTDKSNAAICAGTIKLAHELGLEVIAEGAETEEQAKHIKRIGGQMVQGYYYSRPLPADDVRTFFAKYHTMRAADVPHLGEEDAAALENGPRALAHMIEQRLRKRAS